MSDLEKALQAVVPASRVTTAAIDRIRLAADASFYRLIPQAVVEPASVEEIRGLFALAASRATPLAFRAAGTSLSGQAITDGVLVDISRHWRRLWVEAQGRQVRVQPGVRGAAVNAALRPFGTRMGPDPASIDACMMGGILANNSSGMCCGVRDNAYHTLASMTMVLPDGAVYDSARDAAVFAATEVGRGLAALRDEVRADETLVARIRRKYAIKNTTGYGLNAFLDFEEPIEILAHLMIGSEGTLGFIAEAVLQTVPDPPLRLTGLLLFASVGDACAAIPVLADAGAAALELMDRASLASVEHQPGIPEVVKGLPAGATALLVEFQSADEGERGALAERLVAASRRLPLIAGPEMAESGAAREALWKIRKGLYPSVGAVRKAGTTVIIEDFAVPLERLGTAVDDLQRLFAAHGYPHGIVFGHARDGNLHFVITQSFNDEAAVAQYRSFIEAVVDMIAGHGGSLKAEHGTGRNMAPFVETEWGDRATSVMRRLKRLLDPAGVVNPGVVLTDDPLAHVRHLKDCPLVAPEVDRCIECGFCEPRCPSRDLTMTPRQRIVAMREVARGTPLGAQLREAFAHAGEATCAADGMCATSCPVSIDTGTMIKRMRAGDLGGQGRGRLRAEVARLLARHWEWVEVGARAALHVGHLASRIVGPAFLNRVIAAGDRLAGGRLPRWLAPMPMPARRLPVPPVLDAAAPRYVYFPSCISRMMGPTRREEGWVPELLVRLSARAGVALRMVRPLPGSCCGMPFSSKGYPDAARDLLRRTSARLRDASEDGRLVIVVDSSSCTYTMREHLDEGLRVIDAVAFARDVLLPRLRLRRLQARVAVHPVCSLVKMGLDGALVDVVRACADTAHVPEGAGCCGTAGDRGFMYPELTASATAAEAAALERGGYDRFVASNRMCEVGLTHATGHPFTSFLTLLDAASAEGG